MISKANHWARARHGEDRAQGDVRGMGEKGNEELCYLVADFLEESEEGTHIFLNLTGNIQIFHSVLTEVCSGLS